MEVQTRILIEWESELSEKEALAISSILPSVSDGSVELQTEKMLGGLELIITTIIISMATRVGEKIVDAMWPIIKSLSKSISSSDRKTITLTASWDGGEVKVTLPLEQEGELKRRLNAIGELISVS